ncbi:MAG TPA: hypothetical protein VFJ16_14860 [Longimicrobium sp.]|nr:hypothetical protein [Longimicrobium sp.]
MPTSASAGMETCTSTSVCPPASSSTTAGCTRSASGCSRPASSRKGETTTGAETARRRSFDTRNTAPASAPAAPSSTSAGRGAAAAGAGGGAGAGRAANGGAGGAKAGATEDLRSPNSPAMARTYSTVSRPSPW